MCLLPFMYLWWNVHSFFGPSFGCALFVLFHGIVRVLCIFWMCANKLLQSCPTLCDTMDPPGSSVHGIFPARILEWVALPCFRGFLQRVLCNCEAYDKKTHMYTYVCMYIKSTMVKVVSLEIASSIEIKSIISNFLGAGWRIWPSNYSPQIQALERSP